MLESYLESKESGYTYWFGPENELLKIESNFVPKYMILVHSHWRF